MATPPFQHLVVLMLENRSFDQMFGFLESPTYAIDGFDPNNLPACDPAVGNSPVQVTPDARTVGDLSPDPAHDFLNVNVQIFGNKDATVTGPLMRGFVKDYATVSNDPTKGANVMKCFTAQTLPVLSTLAKQFGVCDQWFSSVPGSTIPNRLFTHAAHSGGSLTQDAILGPLKLKTIFEVLDDPENPYNYRIYTGTAGGSILLTNLYLIHHQNGFHPYSEFIDDCAHGDLPAYTFIEPRYDDDVANGLYANSQHPDFPIDEGEALIADVYSAIRNSPLWPTTLLLIVYDEHGGIFDHVSPPVLTPDPKYAPVPESTNPSFQFDRLGVRVPAVFVSPLIKPGTIISQQFDHCSIVATVRKLFCLDKTPFNWREAQAKTFDNILNLAPANIRNDQVMLPAPFAAGGAPPQPQVRTPSDLTTYMAQGMQLAADTLGVKLSMHVSNIYSAQDAINFLRQAASQLKSKG